MSSSSDEEESEDILSTTNFVVNTKSYTKLPKASESRRIIINVHSPAVPVHKIDKLIQTEHALKTLSIQDETPIIRDLSSSQFSQERRESNSILHEPPGGKFERSFSSIYKKKFVRLSSSESFEENPMESRKQNVERYNKPPSNKQSDLERRRLEAELKAVEEIAKLRQTIIEKRLALELATIDDAAELQNRSFVNHSLQAELRALEEIALRKQSLIETNLAQEFETVEYQRCRSPPSPPPPPPPPPIASHYLPTPFQYSPTPKPDPYKTESSSSILNPLRGGIGFLEKKLNLDRKFSYDSGQRSPVPTPIPIPPPTAYPQQYMDPRMRKDDGYNTTADTSYQYQTTQEYGRTQSAWRTAVAKIRSKIRSRASDGPTE